MTEDEIEVLSLLGRAFVAAKALPVMHPHDLPEFAGAIHIAQNIILAREGLRALKGGAP